MPSRGGLGGGFKAERSFPHWQWDPIRCTFGLLTGFEPSLCAAAGMLATFVGVTNCPIATMFLGFELFGFEAMPYFAVAVAISFTLSDITGLQQPEVHIFKDKDRVHQPKATDQGTIRDSVRKMIKSNRIFRKIFAEPDDRGFSDRNPQGTIDRTGCEYCRISGCFLLPRCYDNDTGLFTCGAVTDRRGWLYDIQTAISES